MPKIETTAWFDGELVPVQEIRVSALSHSLHYGTGIFEGIRCYSQTGGGGGVFRLRDHIERLHASARVLGYEVPWSVDRLCEAACETLRANKMESAYIRPLVWLGEGRMGVAGGNNPVHTMIAVWDWGRYLGEEGVRKGIRVLISSHERATGNAAAQRAKVTGQYVTSYLAKNQVARLGLDEALLLDRNGNVPEGTGENLFLASRGKLITPRDSAAILHGITRDTILTLAGDMDIQVEFDALSRTDLYTADEAFLTGTAAEVTPIREVDGRPLRESPGPLTRQFQEAYFALVEGRGPRAGEWVTRV